MNRSDLTLAVEAASAAAVLALGHFHARSDWWEKSPGNPVGIADLEVDALLKAALLGARPDDGWLSEETADTADRLSLRRVWVVDPIDGTRDFVQGRTGWAVSVALVEDNAVTVAALAAPARQQLFVAARGQGATCNGLPLRVADLPSLQGVRLPMDAANLSAPFWPSPWPGETVEKPNSLALRMAKLASAEADAWLEGRTIAEWDVAASALILTEAGGVVTDRHGAPLAFNKPLPVFHGIAAANAALHGEVLARLDHALKLFAARRAKAE
ncbi:inositol monophosphatase family protein [Polymorphobacter fuscus]|uniref:inositol monophosphatase family protein n=1 Tax=Sandarakinorhabdus fusca TaxID=1439888 RepID=UPI0012952E6C|nr:inositol monophosphatase family protein [Polymorphobacter fuscus]NJC09572.1 myo-inositol-1(or 4)-monophosphatase [Polymorphobacter fuscus]